MNRIYRHETRSRGARAALAVGLGFLFLIPVASAGPGSDDIRTVRPSDARELPAPGTITRQFTRAQEKGDRLAVMSGVLSAPSSAAPESIGTSFLRTAPAVLDGVDPATLRHTQTVSFHVGHALRYEQTHRTLPVIGGGSTVVRVDDAGRIRWVASSARPVPTDLDIVPTLSAREALTAAATFAGYDQAFIDTQDLDNTVRLAVYTQPAMNTPRLAYWIELPQDLHRMAVYRGVVDAHTGHVYRLENRVMHGALPTCAPGTKRAYVYPENPLDTPDLACVSMENNIAANEDFLINADIRTGNCIDNNGCRLVLGLFDVHWCDDDPLAAATGPNSDFTAHEPTNDTDPEDTFAEVQMFYHLTKAFDVARALGGFTNLNARPLGAVVNFRPPVDITGDILGGLAEQLCFGGTYNGGASLYAFDNAAFIPAGGFLGYPDSDGLVFGQGNSVDFAYDGDVVYHEFGHALMNTVAPDLQFALFDQHGMDPSPGGMHEGYADLMTLWVTDDPEVGEYAGSGFGLPAIRDLDNTNACPAHLVGETHEDALPIAGAIWQAREAIVAAGGDKTTFDEAVFAAQQTFDGNENYETAAAKTVAEVEVQMGQNAADMLSAVLSERGISDCNDRIADGTLVKELLFTGSLQIMSQGILPAPVQFEYPLPGGADSIAVDIERVADLTGLGGTLSVAMKSGAPITWTGDGNGMTGDYTASYPITFDPENPGPANVTIPGPITPGTHYLQLFIEGGTVALVNTDIRHQGGVQPGPDAGPGGNADAGGNPGDGDGAGGCCSVNGGSGVPMGSLFLCVVVGLVITRRRR